MPVSVIIPTLEQQFLRFTLDALCNQEKVCFEVIVVENGGMNAETRSLARSYSNELDLKFIACPPLGLNHARNAGAAAANGDVIVFTDDDCVPRSNWLRELVRVHDRHPDAAVVGGRILLRDLGPVPRWTRQYENLLSKIDWGDASRPLTKGEWIAGANLSFKRRCFEQAGGFTPNLGMCGRAWPQLGNDEIECVKRVSERSGHDAMYAANAIVEHQIPPSRRAVEYLEQRSYGQGQSYVDQLMLELEGRRPFKRLRSRLFRDFRSQRFDPAAINSARAPADNELCKTIRVALALVTGTCDRFAQSNPGLTATDFGDFYDRAYRAGRGHWAFSSSESTVDTVRRIALLVRLFRIQQAWCKLRPRRAVEAVAGRVATLNGLLDALLGRGRKAAAGVVADDGRNSTA